MKMRQTAQSFLQIAGAPVLISALASEIIFGLMYDYTRTEYTWIEYAFFASAAVTAILCIIIILPWELDKETTQISKEGK